MAANMFRIKSFAAAALAAKNSASGEIATFKMKQQYSEAMLNKVVMNEYLKFMPALSHYHVSRRVKTLGDTKSDNVHFVEEHWIAALFLDISGFTRLSQALGAEKTKLHCNKFFSIILKVIAMFGGDTLKFLGDAKLNCLGLAIEAGVVLVHVGRAQAAGIKLIKVTEK